jgi:hypothetical protein
MARIKPRHSVACPFPQEELTVSPKMTNFMGFVQQAARLLRVEPARVAARLI